MRHSSRPRRLDWTPVRLGFLKPEDRTPRTLPRGCPRVELAPNSDRSAERDRVALKSRRGERMIFEGADQRVCSRPAQAKGESALTLISCLVQPRGCNPVAKKAVQTKRHRSTGSEGNDAREEKNLLWRRSIY